MYAITIEVRIRDDSYEILAKEVAELRLPLELIAPKLTDTVFTRLFDLAMGKAEKTTSEKETINNDS